MADPHPVIIIGAARSGTKFLRDVLASANGVSSVPYDVNYIWRYGAEDASDDILDPDSLNEKRISFIRKSLYNLAAARSGDILLEKTVSNSLRVPFVERIFPEARYVHLIRDGRAVTESAMRQWQKPPHWGALWTKVRSMPLANIGYATWFGKNLFKGVMSGRGGGNVWGPRFPNIEKIAERDGLAEVCARQWVESVSRASNDLAAVRDAETRVFEIRYENLVVGEDAIRNLVSALELPDPEAILSAHRNRLRPIASDQWRTLTTEEQEVINGVLTPVLVEKGYAL